MVNGYFKALSIPLLLEAAFLLLDHFLGQSKSSLFIVLIVIPLCSYRLRKAGMGRIAAVLVGLMPIFLDLAFAAALYFAKSTFETQQTWWAAYAMYATLAVFYGLPMGLFLSTMGSILAADNAGRLSNLGLALGYLLPFLVISIASGVVSIFGFDDYDQSLGQQGSLQMFVVLDLVVAVVIGLGTWVGLLISRKVLRSLNRRSLLLAGLVFGVIATPLFRMFDDLMFMLPICFIAAAMFPAIWFSRARRSSVEA